MKCPSCHHTFQYRIPDESRERVLALAKANPRYSLREIEVLLREEGHRISHASIHRILKGAKP